LLAALAGLGGLAVSASSCAIVDAIGGSAAAECAETASCPDGGSRPDAPVALAGADQAVARGMVVSLDGSHSRPVAQLAFEWTLEAPGGSSAELVDAGSARPSFTADREGRYVATLVVGNEAGSASDSVTITATNNRPGVDAGADRKVYTGTMVVLDGSASDADGDSLTLQWSIVSAPPGSTAELEDPTTANPALVPDRDGIYSVQLVASDGGRESMPDVVEVTSYRPLTSLGYRVVDAEYSRSRDRLVTVSESPHQLHMYPVGGGEPVVVPFPDGTPRPTSVSVSPDGSHAAVGHDSAVTWVRLSDRTIRGSRSVGTVVFDIALADNEMAYVMPESGPDGRMYCLGLTGPVTRSTGGPFRIGTRAKASPIAPALYAVDGGLSSEYLMRFDITSPTANFLYDTLGASEPICGDLWMSEDGERIFTRCGKVFMATSSAKTDMTYAGTLDDGVPAEEVAFQHLDHSSLAGQVAAIPMAGMFQDPGLDTSLRFYDDESSDFLGSVPLTSFLIDGAVHAAHGRFLFFSKDGRKLIVIVRADESAGVDGGDAVAVYDL
jgi:chitinase